MTADVPTDKRKAIYMKIQEILQEDAYWIYDEEQGAPDEGIPPGTRWEDVPPNWSCPECGARKEDFEMVEI